MNFINTFYLDSAHKSSESKKVEKIILYTYIVVTVCV